MPKFIIERNILGAGRLSLSEMQVMTEQSCGVLRSLGPQIQWVESYITDDKVYCVYIAESEELIRAHALRSGFAADRVTRVRAMVDPTLSEVQLRRAAPVGTIAEHAPPTSSHRKPPRRTRPKPKLTHRSPKPKRPGRRRQKAR